ncbi:MAG: VanZ family protein [Pseudomonadota bacterium]
MGDVWQAFRYIENLQFDFGSRAYWVANILLYIPLSFIWLSILSWSDRLVANIGAAILVLGLTMALSLGIEVAQVFFPPRTVSLNDLIAETIGSVIGLLLWCLVARDFRRWYANVSKGVDAAFFAAVCFYIVGLLAFSLLPFGFVVPRGELSYQVALGQSSAMFSPMVCENDVRCAASMLLELFAVFPIGLLVAKATKFSRAATIGIALLTGAALGIANEAIQFFLYSGTTRGLSILTRTAGVGLGALTFLNKDLLVFRTAKFFNSRRRVRLLAMFAAPVYLITLVVLANWKTTGWLDWHEGLARLEQIRFVPFYYHYYTTETAALRSLVATIVMYAPIGGLVIWFFGSARKSGMLLSIIVGGLSAALLEFAKLFQSGLRPDPTNVLLAASAACAGYLFMQWLSKLHLPAEPVNNDLASVSVPVQFEARSLRALPPARDERKKRFSLLSVLGIAILAWAVSQYPLNIYWLTGALIMYAGLLWAWPQAWILILPAALPVLDLAPITGRFYFDELDIMLVATLALGASWAPADKRPLHRLSGPAWLALTLFSLSTVSAIVIGAYPFPALDINSFNNYYSSYNGLRLAKGLLWVLLLLPLIRDELERDAARTHRLFALGMTFGVLAASLVVLAERQAFTGLLDLHSHYRVVGTFSGMHTGGAFIEGYLATALVFVVWWTKKSPHWLARVFGIGVLMLGSYAMMVTYARGGYLALGASLVVFGIAVLLKKRSLKISHVVAATVLLSTLAAVTIPFVQGNAMQNRFSTTERDMRARIANWRDAVRMMNDDLLTKVAGMGLGRYPAIHFWRNGDGFVPATFAFKMQAANTYLELGAGDPLYLEQLINLQPQKKYQLRFSARATRPDAILTLPVCEKWMLYSATCIWLRTPVGDTNGEWKNFTLNFDTGKFGNRAWYAKRPIKLSLTNLERGTVLGVDNVSLNELGGVEMLRNGSFEEGMDQWFFSTDNHDAWHLENTWLQVYFEQGGIGLLLFVSLLAITAAALVKRHRESEAPIPALAAALTGFLTVATVNSLFDYSRMALLFYLLIAWVLLQPRARRRRHSRFAETSTSGGG